jgi:ribulose-5-phosphate 4-epimerase/fuculose-1-phosphate aldolase
MQTNSVHPVGEVSTSEQGPLSTAAPEQANIPSRPVSADLQVEREFRKWQLSIGYRVLARFGLDEGIAGHITARDTIEPTSFWTAPFGAYFGAVRSEELLLVSEDGDVVEGDGPLNRAAFAIHSSVHRARPDVAGAVHAHGLYGKAFSSLHTELLPLTQDACAFYLDHGIHNDYSGVVFDCDEGEQIAAALGNAKAVILANHGHLTVGSSVGSAVWWFVTMERSMQAQLLAFAAGEPKVIDSEAASRTHAVVGPEDVGAFAFSALAKRIVFEQPDMSPPAGFLV